MIWIVEVECRVECLGLLLCLGRLSIAIGSDRDEVTLRLVKAYSQKTFNLRTSVKGEPGRGPTVLKEENLLFELSAVCFRGMYFQGLIGFNQS